MASVTEQTLNDLLLELQQSRFYGSIELKFEAGRVVLIKKTETIKLPIEEYRDKHHKPPSS